MPEAEKFTALGAGNGFPECIRKEDITDYDYWTTFSGWSKTSTPSDRDASIAESHALAMSIYWNLHSVSVNTEAKNLIDGVGFILNEDVELKTPYGYIYKSEYDTLEAQEPMPRVCIPDFWPSTTVDEDGENYFRACRGTIRLTITRMYLGSTDDESNFIGYGGDEVRSSDEVGGSSSIGHTHAQWGGYAAVGIGGFVDDETQDFLDTTYGHKSFISGGKEYHFAASAIARKTEDRLLPSSRKYVGLTEVSSTRLYARSQFIDDGSVDLESYAEITGLSFYTYPD